MENITKEQKDFNTIMGDYEKEMVKYHDDIVRNNTPILKSIKEEKGNAWFEELNRLISESVSMVFLK